MKQIAALRISPLVRTVGMVLLLFGLAALLLSSANAGYLSAFDIDELHQAQVQYLLSRGNVMFRDFFNLYSPVFYWVFSPVYSFFGFSFDTIRFVRFAMVLLFGARLGLGFLISSLVFSPAVGLLFILFHASDPLTLATAMQIRPDNLMLTFFMAGLYVFLRGMWKNSHRHLLVSGVLLGLSFVTNIKIAPLLGVGAVFFLWWASAVVKKRGLIAPVATGLLVPVVLFAVAAQMSGTLEQTVQTLLFDAPLTNATRMYPVRPGSYYLPGNNILYGSDGRSFLWFFTLLLPLVAFAGAHSLLAESFAGRLSTKKHGAGALLALFLVAGFLAIQFVPSVFLQYYIPVTWLYALLTAVAVWRLWEAVSADGRLRYVAAAGGVILLSVLVLKTIDANAIRAANTSSYTEAAYKRRWAQIPPDEPVFPDMLFRPNSYAFTVGDFIGEIPLSIRDRYPSIPASLEKNAVRFVVIDGYGLQFLKPEDQEYIRKNYVAPDSSDPDFRVRIR